jgi:hypothetical protein
MKKIWAILCFALILSLCACRGTKSNFQDNTSVHGNSSIVSQVEQPKVCEHSWSNATCISPKKCSICGKTEGTTIAHNYSSGKCTRCGQADPNAEKIKKALKDSERYVNYIDIEADIILNKIELYRINGKASLLIDMQESVNKIDSYYAKIYNYCSPYKELYPLYSECDKDMPIFSSSSLAKLKTYATQAGRLKTAYDVMCDNYN